MYHGEACPRTGLFQGREKQGKVRQGAPDHSLPELSLKTSEFHDHAPPRTININIHSTITQSPRRAKNVTQ
eukprot:1149012-Pelagomonas_calceolata.AAC.7